MRYARENYIKWAAYGMLLLLIYLVQTSYHFQFSVLGVHPDLLSFFVAAVALFEGPACAGAVGFFTGLLTDTTLTGLDGFYPFYYIAFGILSGLFAEKYFRRNILAGMVLGALASIGQNLFKYFFYYGLIFRAPFFNWNADYAYGTDCFDTSFAACLLRCETDQQAFCGRG